MDYISTRDSSVRLSASKAILQGLSKDGGLFVPTQIPTLDINISDMKNMSYHEIAFEVMKKYFDDIPDEDLKECIRNAYDSKFDTEEIAPVKKLNGEYILELFHGSTIAFKDMALSILPYLMTTSARLNNVKDNIVILTATSGDTGKAALAGFASVPGTTIIVFYPKDGVSPIQKLQMLTQKGDNTHVIGIEGNFDDAQTGVKRIFNDKELEQQMNDNGYRFSSANSINIGRLVPQIVYYFYSYSRLLKNGDINDGEAVNFVVPTGNFGNILAAFYAKQMGLPIHKLICASNENKVLYDFFKTGTYDRNREFILTTSPSMDILISSNLERLLFNLTGNNSEETRSFMEQLISNGKYNITDDEMKKACADFYGNYASEAECDAEIEKTFKEENYVFDPHTAVAACVYEKYKEETGDVDTKKIIDSTASPYKFTKTVMCAIDNEKYSDGDDLELTKELNAISGVEIPNAVKELYDAELLHNRICAPDKMEDIVKDIMNIK